MGTKAKTSFTLTREEADIAALALREAAEWLGGGDTKRSEREIAEWLRSRAGAIQGTATRR